jgi:hypothetical protein
MHSMPRTLILLFLLAGLPRSLGALELFGVELESSNASELRGAVKAAGAVLIREADAETRFDVYDSSAALGGSTRLYLGFAGQDQGFAFAEYEFRGSNPKSLLRDLSARYGVARERPGRFESERRYHWQRDGIDIELGTDWHNYRIRLSYVNPPGLAALQAEQSADRAATPASAKQVSLY